MTDTQQVEQNAPAETNKAQITLNMLRQWGACQDGKSWFSNKFPQSAEYGETMTALYADKKYTDAQWLAWNTFDKAFSKEIVISDVNSLIALTKDIGEAEDASGNYAQIGSSGNGAQIGSSGDCAQIGSSGDYARIGSSGYGAQIGSSGNGARIEAAGRNSVTASSGGNVSVKLGKNGAACLAWHDGERNRFTSLYEGEDGIKEGVWYRLGEDGLPVAVEAA